MNLGVEVLTEQKDLVDYLKSKKVSLVAHPASTDQNLQHSMTILNTLGILLKSAFGPQHGMFGDKQDNMVESADYIDEKYSIPVFSLYGDSRRPTQKMMDTFDLCLFDLQDAGCRVYTYLTTLFYMMDECAKLGKELWVLDRPNPSGRSVEGFLLEEGFVSFVGAQVGMPLRHGMTLGELAQYYKKINNLNLELKVIAMKDYSMNADSNYGWPVNQLPWVNPSPNLANLNSVRAYNSTVIFEGCSLSEGRGTTVSLQVMGAPNLNVDKILTYLEAQPGFKHLYKYVRPCYFEPTFHKHKGELCSGVQLHFDRGNFDPSELDTYLFGMGFLKAVRKLQPNLLKWNTDKYEYEDDKLAIDLINGSKFGRLWVDDDGADFQQIIPKLLESSNEWLEIRQQFLIYS